MKFEALEPKLWANFKCLRPFSLRTVCIFEISETNLIWWLQSSVGSGCCDVFDYLNLWWKMFIFGVRFSYKRVLQGPPKMWLQNCAILLYRTKLSTMWTIWRNFFLVCCLFFFLFMAPADRTVLYVMQHNELHCPRWRQFCLLIQLLRLTRPSSVFPWAAAVFKSSSAKFCAVNLNLSRA